MKAHIVITDEDGKTLEGEVELTSTMPSAGRAKVRRDSAPVKSHRLDFDVPIRAFMKSNAGGLSGPRKFVLLVAYLAKGREGHEVNLRDVEGRWNAMTSLMGGKFNRFFSGTARDNGWVETKKTGVYILRLSWRQALS